MTTKQPKWHTVSEKNPENGFSYLIQNKNSSFSLCYFRLYPNSEMIDSYFEDDFGNKFNAIDDVVRYCDLAQLLLSIQ